MWVVRAVIHICVSSGNECRHVGPRFMIITTIILLYIHSLSEHEIQS